MMLNFHTHGNSANPLEVTVRSFTVDEYRSAGILEGFITVGIHPWQCALPSVDLLIDEMGIVAANSNVVAIGEVGFDKLRGGAMEVQMIILVKQLQMAEKLHKPVIIHCVKAWNELADLYRSFVPSTPWAVHGFRGKPELAKHLADLGFFLSFGAILIDASPSLAEALSVVPMDRLFFETDESMVPIAEVYSAASDILNISVDDLARQMDANFETFFGRSEAIW